MKKFLLTSAVVLAVTAAAATTASASGIKTLRLPFNLEEVSEGRKIVTDDGILTVEGEGEFEFKGEIEDWEGTMKRQSFNIGGGAMAFNMSDLTELTDEQKAELAVLGEERNAIEKAYIEKAAAAGIITQEQAEIMLERFNAQSGEDNDRGKTFHFSTRGAIGFAKGDGLDLTDEQKAVIDEYQQAINEIMQKEIDLYVEFGIITEEQAQNLKDMANGGHGSISFSFGFSAESLEPEKFRNEMFEMFESGGFEVFGFSESGTFDFSEFNIEEFKFGEFDFSEFKIEGFDFSEFEIEGFDFGQFKFEKNESATTSVNKL